MEINSKTCDLWRKKLNEALAKVAEEMGMTFDVASIRYDATMMRTQLTFRVSSDGSVGADPTAKFKADLKKYGFAYGATEEMLGLKDKVGNTFIGIAPKRSKYPFAFQKPEGGIVLYTQMHFEFFKQQNGLK